MTGARSSTPSFLWRAMWSCQSPRGKAWQAMPSMPGLQEACPYSCWRMLCGGRRAPSRGQSRGQRVPRMQIVIERRHQGFQPVVRFCGLAYSLWWWGFVSLTNLALAFSRRCVRWNHGRTRDEHALWKKKQDVRNYFQRLFGIRNQRFAICFELRSNLFSTLYGLWRFDIPMHTDYRYFEVCSFYVFYLVENANYACNMCFVF